MRTAGARIARTAAAAGLLLAGACGFDPRWPDGPAERRAVNGDALLAYHIDGAKRPNYFQRVRDGVVRELYFDDDGDGAYDAVVDRRDDSPDWPHCVLVLDGAAWDVADALWREGRLRLFARPSRAISVFPSMTDLAMTRLLRTPPCAGPEALYFDRAANRLRGGHGAYLRGDNAPWLSHLSYHAPQTIGAKAYLSPQEVFDEEMREALRTFRAARGGTAIAYSIGTSGLGTRGGPDAMRRYLLAVEKLCERLVYDKRGRVRITVTADHGHSLRPGRRVRFEPALAAHGFRLSKQIRSDADVASPEYGLVTYAALYTRQPARVAAALATDPAVELAAFVEGDRVVVLSPAGRATIEKREGGHAYAATRGDPLKLSAIVDGLRSAGHVRPDGTIDDRALFDATATHEYPDPLHRLWDCFHGLMTSPPDVAVSLRDDCCHGSWMFEFAIGRVASTHGSLNLANSSACLLSDVGPLPAVLRIEDLMPALERARRTAQRRRDSPASAPSPRRN